MTLRDPSGFPVPTADTADNVISRDVIGNKDDTVAGTSIIARIKQALAALAFPATNAAGDTTIAEVVGRKADASYAGGTSISGRLHTLSEHFHSTQLVRPHLAAAINVAAAAPAWTYGALSGDLVAAASIAVPYDVHGIAIDSMSANDSYQLALVGTLGGVDTVVCEVSMVRTSPQLTSLHIPVQMPLLAANTRLRAKLASAAGSNTINLKVRLHTYT
jgi:hypothetical protein